MNSGNFELSGAPDPKGRYGNPYGAEARDKDSDRREPLDEQAERAANYRRNRDESLQLCNDFHAFYGSHAAYHAEL
ncbi:hypothetical protein [Lewinella sp. IMCC34191]|uniref:hypothetical protein n=1 Tax=Lewinella sp. IMCC34191 TaxID=2259172 RepID=UPI000E21CCEF|nr:hypothetical protein [Lewinella sp. IMCC34191]